MLNISQYVSKSEFGFIEKECDFVSNTLFSIINNSKGFIGALDDNRQNNIKLIENKLTTYG